MNNKQTVFITAAVLVMAALAGVLVIDGADATETEDSYTLTYHVGEETESATQPTPAFTVLDVDELTKLTVPDGKVFDGWFTQPDGKGTAYAKGSTYTIQGTGVTTGDLYAKLTDAPAQTVTVKFNIEGTVYTQTLTVTDGQIVLPTISALGANVPAGQEFKGWSNGGTTYAAGSAMTAPAKDTEFKAVFQDIVYTVTFDIDGTKTTVSGTAADSVAFPADPVKEGMTFKGWSVDGKMVESTAGIKFSANVTYVAVFVEDFGLTFEVNGTVYDGGEVSDPIVPQNPTKEGYNFKGWSVDGKTVIQDLGAYIADVTSETRFIAVFEPVDCLVTFEVDGAIVEAQTQTVKYDSKAINPAFVPTKDGFRFVAWTLDGEEYDFDEAVTEDITLVALFSEIPEPEPTGLKDPMTLTIVAALVIIIGALFVIGFLNKEKLKSKTAAWLTKNKDDKPKEGDGSA